MCIKHLLGVRKNTTNSLCLVELGLPTLKALVIHRQRKYFKIMWDERRNMIDGPFSHALNLVKNSNTATARYVNDLITKDVDDIVQSLRRIQEEVNTNRNQSSKNTYYKKNKS